MIPRVKKGESSSSSSSMVNAEEAAESVAKLQSFLSIDAQSSE